VRILYFYAYLNFIKTRLNITIEKSVLSHVKEYAASHQLSISRIVEDYLKSIIAKQSVKKESIIDIIEKLETPSQFNEQQDLKKAFYEEQSGKYDF
jgi:hypothetical protein